MAVFCAAAMIAGAAGASVPETTGAEPALLLATNSASGEQELLASARAALEEKASGVQEKEAVLDHVARGLWRYDSTESVEMLRRLAAMEPEHLTAVPGCRDPIWVPLSPFNASAALSLRRMAIGKHRADFENRLGAGDVSWVSEITDDETLQAALQLATDDQQRSAMLEALEAREQRTRQQDFLRVELWVALHHVPSVEAVRGLDPDAAVRLASSIERVPETLRESFVAAAQANLYAKSAARLQGTSLGRTTRELLEDGAEGALLLSRDMTPQRLAETASLLMIGDLAWKEKEQAVLALMLADTDETRAALFSAREYLDSGLREKITMWLFT